MPRLSHRKAMASRDGLHYKISGGFLYSSHKRGEKWKRLAGRRKGVEHFLLRVASDVPDVEFIVNAGLAPVNQPTRGRARLPAACVRPCVRACVRASVRASVLCYIAWRSSRRIASLVCVAALRSAVLH